MSSINSSLSKLVKRSKTNTNTNRSKETTPSVQCLIEPTEECVSSKDITLSPRRIIQLKAQVLEAIKKHKTFTIRYGYNGIREALKERGWIEKVEQPNFKVEPAATKNFEMSTEEFTALFPAREPGQNIQVYLETCEEIVRKKLLEGHLTDFYWGESRDGQEKNAPYRNTIRNRLPNAPFTSKNGLNRALREMQWLTKDGVVYTRFPRCYNLSELEDFGSFVKNFRRTACMSMLKYMVNKIQTEGEESIAAVDGVIPLSAVQFAINRCNEYIQYRTHEDIDRTYVSITSHDWNKFLHYQKLMVYQEAKLCDGHIPLGFVVKETERILMELKENYPPFQIDGMYNIWILKPIDDCRGRGITLENNLEEIILSITPKACNKLNVEYVIQKYIERPLIIHNTKFDIRQWFLVVRVRPLIIWMYKEAYLRFSSQIYDLSNFHESVHITNNAIQVNFANAERNPALPEENMWHSSAFQDYLASLGKNSVWEKVIQPGMREAFIGALLGSQDELEDRPNSFEVFGVDYMLDEKFNPWLIEINANPNMSPTTTLTGNICPPCLHDIIKVVIDEPSNPNCDTGKFFRVYKQVIPSLPKQLSSNLGVRGRSCQFFTQPSTLSTRCSPATSPPAASIIFASPYSTGSKSIKKKKSTVAKVSKVDTVKKSSKKKSVPNVVPNSQEKHEIQPASKKDINDKNDMPESCNRLKLFYDEVLHDTVETMKVLKKPEKSSTHSKINNTEFPSGAKVTKTAHSSNVSVSKTAKSNSSEHSQNSSTLKVPKSAQTSNMSVSKRAKLSNAECSRGPSGIKMSKTAQASNMSVSKPAKSEDTEFSRDSSTIQVPKLTQPANMPISKAAKFNKAGLSREYFVVTVPKSAQTSNLSVPTPVQEDMISKSVKSLKYRILSQHYDIDKLNRAIESSGKSDVSFETPVQSTEEDEDYDSVGKETISVTVVPKHTDCDNVFRGTGTASRSSSLHNQANISEVLDVSNFSKEEKIVMIKKCTMKYLDNMNKSSSNINVVKEKSELSELVSIQDTNDPVYPKIFDSIKEPDLAKIKRVILNYSEINDSKSLGDVSKHSNVNCSTDILNTHKASNIIPNSENINVSYLTDTHMYGSDEKFTNRAKIRVLNDWTHKFDEITNTEKLELDRKKSLDYEKICKHLDQLCGVTPYPSFSSNERVKSGRTFPNFDSKPVKYRANEYIGSDGTRKRSNIQIGPNKSTLSYHLNKRIESSKRLSIEKIPETVLSINTFGSSENVRNRSKRMHSNDVQKPFKANITGPKNDRPASSAADYKRPRRNKQERTAHSATQDGEDKRQRDKRESQSNRKRTPKEDDSMRVDAVHKKVDIKTNLPLKQDAEKHSILNYKEYVAFSKMEKKLVKAEKKKVLLIISKDKLEPLDLRRTNARLTALRTKPKE